MSATIWTGQLAFGLVTLPCKLKTAARSERVSFNLLHEPCQSRIKQQLFCPTCERTVERTEIVKGHEHEKDSYTLVSDEELKAIAPESSKTMQVTAFVSASDIDPTCLEGSYYLVPDKGGDKPYALLRAAMQRTGTYAVASICMHQREHVAIVRPGQHGLTLHTLYYESEMNAENEYRCETQVNAKELQLAGSLVDAMLDTFDHSNYADGYQESVLALLDAKRDGRALKSRPAAPKRAKVASIEDALTASLKAVRPIAAKSGRRRSA